MKNISCVLIITVLVIFVQTTAYSQENCMPVSYSIKDLVIKFNLPGCNRYHIEPDHTSQYQLIYKNNIPDMKIIIKREASTEEYAIKYALWMMMNYGRGELQSIGIGGCTGWMMEGPPNHENGKKKIVLKYVPSDLESDDYVCTIETTIDELEFRNIVASFEIEKL